MYEPIPVDFLPSNTWTTLEKLAEHPQGVELLNSFRAFYREVYRTKPQDTENQEKTELIRQALEIVNSRGIVNPPQFETLESNEIQTFIEKYWPS
jgi:hypothetical protein